MISIADRFRALYPAIYVSSQEEKRVFQMVKGSAEEARKVRKKLRMMMWSADRKGVRLVPLEGTTAADTGSIALAGVGTDGLIEVLETIADPDSDDASFSNLVLLVQDADLIYSSANGAPDAFDIRAMRKAIHRMEKVGSCLVLCGTRYAEMPRDLIDIPEVSLPLPSADELKEVVKKTVVASKREVTDEQVNEATQAALGMPMDAATNAFSLALVRSSSGIDPKTVMQEKCAAVAKTQFLTVVKSAGSLSDMAGNDVLRAYLQKQKLLMSEDARTAGLPFPKGIVVDGPGGTGKSMLAAIIGAELGAPVLCVDVGAMFAPYVGETERNVRQLIQVAEAIGRVILWFDELDTATSGMGTGRGGGGDHGTSDRVMSSLLRWFAECRHPIFKYATTNNAWKMHAPFLRAGRWDKIFYVDFPSNRERAGIWATCTRRVLGYERARAVLGENAGLINDLVEASKNWTGAEINQAVEDAARETLSTRKPADLMAATRGIRPIYDRMGAQDIAAMREWWRKNAVAASGDVDDNSSGGSSENVRSIT